MIILSKEQVIRLHSHLIAETGILDGLRDENLLDSALNAPFQSFEGMDAFPSIQQKLLGSDMVLSRTTLLMPEISVSVLTLCLFFSHSIK